MVWFAFVKFQRKVNVTLRAATFTYENMVALIRYYSLCIFVFLFQGSTVVRALVAFCFK
jgi:hypothetical protein